MPAASFGQGQNPPPPSTTPDNSANNNNQHATADQQSDRNSDLMITKKIRESLVADKSLSMCGHNVKIITRNGAVTLKGPVHSEEEKQSIASKAEEVVGSADKVDDRLTVKQ
jgi:osmotically-inducible protein OsmY